MEDKDIVNKSRLHVEELLSNLDPCYTYHNLTHTLSVYHSASDLIQNSQLQSEEEVIIKIAALFHDVGFSEGAVNHEIRSAQAARSFLEKNNVSTKLIDRIEKCILDTKMGTSTKDSLSMILQDADLNHLASDQYQEISESLRKEKNNTSEQNISKKEWKKINKDFLQNHSYKSAVGQEKYNLGLQKNIQLLMESNNSKKTKTPKAVTITNSKNAQTQFKTALRNHIDLSNIADNKANIMISVNALILTVALPFLIERSISNPVFWFSTLLLAAVCLMSMIFATLATRPISMSGRTTEQEIANNKSNLFFFGNYFKMDYDSYKANIKEVVKDDNKLDDSIITDLYFLGKSLGKKFSFLRWCYNSFMYGIILVVFSFLMTYFF